MAKDSKKIKLLLITQKVDINDDVLGFMHGWIKKLAEKLESVDVVCLYRGGYDLPGNVRVYSLGKETGRNRIKYLWRLYKYAWKLLPKNDLVFVHMNHKYIILLWPLAKIFKKPMVLWKTRRGMRLSLKIAIKLVAKVLTASKLSLDYSGKKKKVLGHGINTKAFSLKPYPDSKTKKIISVGRITPIKNQHILIRVAHCLINKLGFKNVRFEIVGEPKLKKDFLYLKKIKRLIKNYGLSNYFIFRGKIPNKKMPMIYYNCEALIDLARGAGLDKAPLEAMSCGRMVFVSQPALKESLGRYKEELSINWNDLQGTAKKIKTYLKLERKEKEKIGRNLRKMIVKNHSLDNFIDNLIHIFTSLV